MTSRLFVEGQSPVKRTESFLVGIVTISSGNLWWRQYYEMQVDQESNQHSGLKGKKSPFYGTWQLTVPFLRIFPEILNSLRPPIPWQEHLIPASLLSVGNVLLVTRWLILTSAYKSWQSMMVSHRTADQLKCWDSSINMSPPDQHMDLNIWHIFHMMKIGNC